MSQAKDVRIPIRTSTGAFAEDKDLAASLRESQVRPTLKAGHRVVFDFKGVTLTTQSFVHALISDVLRSEGESALDKMVFEKCSSGVKGIVQTVVQYTLESVEPESEDEGAKAAPGPTRRKK